MSHRPLEGIKVVEVSMWAFVPTCGAVLSDWGAEVIKIEPPAGDPIRNLNMGGIAPGTGGFTFMYEIYNRGKRSVAMDLNAEGATELLHRLVADADVFLTSLLPSARSKLKIDEATLRAVNPRLIYAAGNGQGARGEEADKGGYDQISFWCRSGIASAATLPEMEFPAGMPGAAFGDTISGLGFAGGIAAAIAHRERTGEGMTVDGSLLGTAMWALQPSIVATKLLGIDEMPKAQRTAAPNPLVNNYRTKDGRFVALCMLQGQRYWPGFCTAIGREDLIEHPDFADDASRAANIAACLAELDATFATRDLEEWKAILATQDGQWNIVQKAGELTGDPAALANGFVQDVDYDDGRTLTMVSTPVQFDAGPSPARPAAELGADTDAVMASLGLSEDEIIEAKVAGILL
jgi:crotonobetainyl-CoA:carnitine CoA-transferase CaiB-like acyl-CoA transferase